MNHHDGNVTLIDSEPPVNGLTEAQKYKRALRIAQNLASVACEGGMKLFKERIAEMEGLLGQWRNAKIGDQMSLPERISISFDDFLEEKLIKIDPVDSTDAGMNTSNVNSPSSCYSLTKDHEESNADQNESSSVIKMPPKMLKRGRPKGAEVTVIGLPRIKKAKQENGSLKPFAKLGAKEKDRILLECFVSPKIAKQSLQGFPISPDRLQTNVHLMSDLVRNSNSVDIHRIEKYFSDDAWMIVLELIRKKGNCKWTCPRCSKSIKNADDRVACDRCFCWFHFPCVSVKKRPKSKYWFCRNCKNKYK
eukprot:Seg1647.2 transcript_id=Seg1647.2/GoldUCD/mRNA.D3Y31 product="Transcription initiation factor TFIID subunit 3" protein_id=Seg1647.2/GoldUCD/D3Y31